LGPTHWCDPPKIEFSCFLAVDVTRLKKSSQIAAARGLLTGKRSPWLYFIPSDAQREMRRPVAVDLRLLERSANAGAHWHSVFKASVSGLRFDRPTRRLIVVLGLQRIAHSLTGSSAFPANYPDLHQFRGSQSRR
jgi:hypothetical protein